MSQIFNLQPKQGEKIRYYKNSKTVLNGKPGGYYSYSSIGVIGKKLSSTIFYEMKKIDSNFFNVF